MKIYENLLLHIYKKLLHSAKILFNNYENNGIDIRKKEHCERDVGTGVRSSEVKKSAHNVYFVDLDIFSANLCGCCFK